MKKTYRWAGPLKMIMALQICLFSAAWGQDTQESPRWSLLTKRRTFSRITETRLRINDKLLFSSKTNSMTWQMITRADLKVQGEQVELHQDGKILYLRVISAAPFEVKEVSLSPPPLTYDKNIEGLKRLEIHWKREDFQGDTATLDIELDTKPF